VPASSQCFLCNKVTAAEKQPEYFTLELDISIHETIVINRLSTILTVGQVSLNIAFSKYMNINYYFFFIFASLQNHCTMLSTLLKARLKSTQPPSRKLTSIVYSNGCVVKFIRRKLSVKSFQKLSYAIDHSLPIFFANTHTLNCQVILGEWMEQNHATAYQGWSRTAKITSRSV
jgi:predicted small integral membrane protein